MGRIVRYGTTEDGVRIAYSVEGEGPPLLVCPYWIESFSVDHLAPFIGAFISRLREGRQLIRFDGRGTGLSQREFDGELSLEAHCRDLDAVVNATGLNATACLAPIAWGPMAAQYAASKPDKVTALILWGTYATPDDAFSAAALESLAGLCRTNWASAAQLFGDWSGRETHAELGLQAGAVNAASTSGEIAARFILEGSRTTDVRGILASITAPTLVLHRLHSAMVPVTAGQALAAGIPGAVFVPLSGHTGHWAGEDPDETLDAINGFLVPAEERLFRWASQGTLAGTAIILFADIVDSTALTERLGDRVFRTKSRDLDVKLRRIIGEAGGTTIDAKTLGDGILATFPAAAQAIAAALSFEASAQGVGLVLHVGLHAGDVIREQDNVYGGAVNIASRICGLSAPGEILVSATVRDLARTSADVSFEDRGEQLLKGIDDPVRVFAVG